MGRFTCSLAWFTKNCFLHSLENSEQSLFLQVSYLATDCLFPEWKIWTQFLDESTEGLRLDGLAESHPIEVN